MSVGDRIREARKARGMTQQALAEALGRSQSVVSDLERGGLESWRQHGRKLATVLGRPREWFEEGGEAPDQPPSNDASDDLPAIVEVPEYDVRLSAGGGFIVDRESTRRMWPLPRFLVVDALGLSPNRVTIQEIVGDSMSPTLETGDYVLIDLSDQRLGLPGIFAVWDGDALVCKRLERIPGTDPLEVRIKSDNPLHGEYQVLGERVNVVGRVRWFTRRM
jgi:phage repressor protein C with HTH and peptisase S24 domain